MSRLFGDVAHQAYVVPDFDAALEKLNAAGIGPAFVLRRIRGAGRYRGERHDSLISAAFAYSGNTCIEILTPHDDVPSAYREYLERRPEGGLHHIAYFSDDIAGSIASWLLIRSRDMVGHPAPPEAEAAPEGSGEPVPAR